MYIERSEIMDFFSIMNTSGIDYVLIKNIGNELPDYLEDGKDIDILVREAQMVEFGEFMRNHKFRELTPPNGRKNGWNFAYQLPEYQFWQKEGINQRLYIDASFKLACKSLTPQTWIPLDKKINEDIWKKRVFDESKNWWIMDDKTLCVYLIVRSVLDKHEFKAVYVDDLEQMKNLLDDEEVRMKLRTVFFKFTEKLIVLLKEKRYSEIYYEYITFIEY